MPTRDPPRSYEDSLIQLELEGLRFLAADALPRMPLGEQAGYAIDVLDPEDDFEDEEDDDEF